MKTCFKCNKEKPLADFYKHLGMADGYLGKCKVCTKLDANKHRQENLEKVREYDKLRAKNPERRKANVAINKAWRQQDERRAKCHSAVSRAIRLGELVRKNCEKCNDENSLAHHEDYDKPLNVNWLCQICHKQRHKELKGMI